MDEFVTTLRELADYYEGMRCPESVSINDCVDELRQAADELERLQAENARFRRSLVNSGFEDNGGEALKPPVNAAAARAHQVWVGRVRELEAENEALRAWVERFGADAVKLAAELRGERE